MQERWTFLKSPLVLALVWLWQAPAMALPPSAPSLDIVPGDQKGVATIQSNNNPKPSTDFFTLYWLDHPGVTKKNGNKVTSPELPVTGLSNGTLYYFVATQTNGATEEESVESTERAIMPGRPSGLAARYNDPEALTLSNGLVLIVDGNAAQASLYDPTAQSWQATNNPSGIHQAATLTLLSDGRVLVFGGDAPPEIYNPATGRWSLGKTPPIWRIHHTATLLLNGKVLVAGGQGSDPKLPEGTQASAFIYDPATDSWSPTGSLQTPMEAHQAVRLADGKVFVFGGADAELYDPSTGVWTEASAFLAAWTGGAVNRLQNGDVLVAGGVPFDSLYSTSDAYLYNPATDRWSATGSLSTPRTHAAATLLSDGRVLVAGGDAGGTSEIYDPSTAQWTPAGPLHQSRFHAASVLLSNGDVLVMGGQQDFGVQVEMFYSIERYTDGKWVMTPLSSSIPLTISTAPLPPAIQGYFYNARISISGGTSLYNVEATNLPPGLQLNPGFGGDWFLSGVPTQAGSSQMVLQATDFIGTTARATLSFSVGSEAAGPITLSVNRPSLEFIYDIGKGFPDNQAVSLASFNPVAGVPLSLSVPVNENWLQTTLDGIATPLNATISVNPNGLSIGTYTGSVLFYSRCATVAVPISLKVENATPSPKVSNFSTLKVYPNPWRSGKNNALTYEGLPDQSTIKIFTLSGREVATIPHVSGKTTWNLKNNSGENVASGLYIYLVSDAQGNNLRGRFAVIR